MIADDPVLDSGVTPTSAHSLLKEIIRQLQQDAEFESSNFIQSGGVCGGENSANQGMYKANQMYLSESYEDLLSMAIINKVSTFVCSTIFFFSVVFTLL